MKKYKHIITLSKNNRGCYIFDTVKGCSAVNKYNGGCYGDCYAANIAYRYGFDFSDISKREFDLDKSGQLYFLDFYDVKHENKIIKQIKNISMPFVRIGEMGDPSECWQHTINMCKTISVAKKHIVIITKHWHIIPDRLLSKISELDLTINTSISALDSDLEIETRLKQFNRLKKYCNSVLRIVSCDFNKKNNEGNIRSIIQDKLFENKNVIDTVFRPSLNNPLVVNGVINTKHVKFLKSKVLASVFNDNTYFSNCSNCPEMCGIVQEEK